MRITHLRQADLNLLVVFTVLAEERHVSRAAERLLLSQPAVTRAMQRLRDMFRDELLIRVSGQYELTPKGENLLQEVETMLPRLDRLLAGSVFDPRTERARFRLAGSDYASCVVGIPLAKAFLDLGENLSFDLSPINDEVFVALERGRIDLLFYANDSHIPAHLTRETIFHEQFVCIVSKTGPYATSLTLKQYLDALHIGVATFGDSQTVPDQRLAEAGFKRRYAFRVPFFDVAIRTVPGTNLIATVPKRLAKFEAANSDWKAVPAPKLMSEFSYLMAWHPRMEDDAGHVWLRSMIRKVCRTI